MADNIQIDVETTQLNVDVFVTEASSPSIGIEYSYPQGPKGDSGSSLWGTISGTLSAQSDLWRYLSAGGGTSNFDITTLNTYLSTNSITLCSTNTRGQILSAGIDLFNIFSTNQFVNSKFLPLSGGNITGNLTINGNISGNNLKTSFNLGSATGNYSFAENSGRASGDYSHAEGYATTASGGVSHAEGNNTTASGDASHAEGLLTIASGLYSHAEGANTTAAVNYSHAEGYNTYSNGWASHTEGQNTTTAGSNYYPGITSGQHAEGISTNAEGDASHAEGMTTVAHGYYSHAEGQDTVSYGRTSHAAGYKATAAQNYTYAWSDGNLGTATANVSSTRTGQYMVSASGGVFIPGKVGIGIDSYSTALSSNTLIVNGDTYINNNLTVKGNLSATGVVYASQIVAPIGLSAV